MTNGVLQQKLVSLQRCIQRIRDKSPKDAAVLESDYDLQDIIILNLQRAIQVSTDIATYILSETSSVPSTMAESFLMLHQQGILSKTTAERMSRSIGLRNIAIHEYTNLNWVIVHAVASKHLEDFVVFGREVAAWVDRDHAS